MKEKPILFSGPMVKAILDGRKTMTRRVIKPQPPSWLCDGREPWNINNLVWGFADRSLPRICHSENTICCPFPVGTRLWVRETWQHEDNSCNDHTCGNSEHVFYKATDPAPDSFASWRPSIFMPRWASRINLEVIGVKVERLQEISFKDAKAEGCPLDWEALGHCCEKGWLETLWDSINGKRPSCSWSENPWCWCYTFRRLP